jgi:hypothetical protein
MMTTFRLLSSKKAMGLCGEDESSFRKVGLKAMLLLLSSLVCLMTVFSMETAPLFFAEWLSLDLLG